MALLSENPFVGLPLVDLQRKQGLYSSAIDEIALTGQSYNVEGRTFSAADLDKIKETLLQINNAITAATSRGSRRVAYPRIVRN
jgi:hypothetical protein